ncbi:MAG: ABC transporter ATP-binding protein [Bacteroidetes bacterium]|nr:ABC transporter ATP-binding protein [Bacteroidota bacterium]
MKNVFHILKNVIPYRKYALLNILFNIFFVLFSLVSLAMIIPILQLLFGLQKLVLVKPDFVFKMDSIIASFNYYISKIIIEYGKVEALIFICVLVIVLFFFKNFFRYMAMYYLANVRNGVVMDIRNNLYHKILILPLSYYTEQKKGDIIARMTNDVQEVEWSIMTSLEMVFRDPLSIIGFLVTLIIISPQLTLFVFILLPVTAFLISRIGKSLKRSSDKVQKKMGSILSVIEETISGLRIIKAFNAIGYSKQKFNKINENYTRLMIKVYRKRDLANPLSEFLGVLVLVIIIWFGGNLVLGEKANIPPVMFIYYVVIFSQLIVPAKSITTAYYNLQKGSASVDRIKEVLDAEEIIMEKPDAVKIKEFRKDIVYRNVRFTYEKEEVLSNINLTINKGKTIALVGPSGGGKSTMVDLLPRFYDCTEGEIIIDGITLKDFKINDLRGLMGIVTQESILFNDTVFNNIAFGLTNVNEEQVIEAATIANAHEFIMELENGYHTYIGDRGGKLSGGQRQRLSIARAILKNPPILILDEATSALDTESERLVQDALEKLMKNRTSLVIAHRLSTIQHADEIIVIQKGEIIERGMHSELVEKNGLYKKLFELQSFS